MVSYGFTPYSYGFHFMSIGQKAPTELCNKETKNLLNLYINHHLIKIKEEKLIKTTFCGEITIAPSSVKISILVYEMSEDKTDLTSFRIQIYC